MAPDNTSRSKSSAGTNTTVVDDNNLEKEKDQRHNDTETSATATTSDNNKKASAESTTSDNDESATDGQQTVDEKVKDATEQATTDSVWAEAWDDQSQAYYWWNTITYETTWEDPNVNGTAATPSGTHHNPSSSSSPSSRNDLDSVLDTIDAKVRTKLDGNSNPPASSTGAPYSTYNQYNTSSYLDNQHLGATDPYRFQAFFNTKTGRFQTSGDVAQRNPENYSIEARGRRQMEHYFDVDAYQAERNQQVEQGRKRSLTKKEIERNNRKQRRHALKFIAAPTNTTEFYPAVEQPRSFPHGVDPSFTFTSSGAFEVLSPLSNNSTTATTISTLRQEQDGSIDFSTQALYQQPSTGKRSRFNPSSSGTTERINTGTDTDTFRHPSGSAPRHFNLDLFTPTGHSSSAPSVTPGAIFGSSSRSHDDRGPSTKGMVEGHDSNAFSLTTAWANFEKLATQPPNQMEVALIIDCVDACSQHQTVMHTKVLPATHYMELPERARMEINQVDELIADVSRRCDYNEKQATPILQGRMESTRHDQEMIHYVSKLGALSSRLQCQVNVVEDYFELLKEQIQHLTNEPSVIDFYNKRPPGDESAWARHGYGSYVDDYFGSLLTSLTCRLEESKSRINEIDEVTSSWRKNRSMLPQDLFRTMGSQNEIFLVLANHAAVLHDRLNMAQSLSLIQKMESLDL
ncbi:hypothetical protein [Absidia glauca]|uniref:WW domain-containing protein n=1 Tax=Absidia glauca TaxID=4829 RepID=A0A168KSK3_ABSGL|nr:hypothetical protein [Absidia glauca]